jgi:hypothetical protein
MTHLNEIGKGIILPGKPLVFSTTLKSLNGNGQVREITLTTALKNNYLYGGAVSQRCPRIV